MSIKICPKCLNTHYKNGKFCSRSCANSRGPRSDHFKKTVSEKLTGRTGVGVLRLPRIKKKCCGCDTMLDIPCNQAHINRTCGSSECKSVAASIGGRKSAKERCKRSKDEIKLYELYKSIFPDALCNFVIADNWDADIVLPHHKIAILWNGPWHYKEMNMKNHSLSQVQTRDKIKTNLFKSLNWTVLVYEDRHYTPETAFKDLVLRVGFEPT